MMKILIFDIFTIKGQWSFCFPFYFYLFQKGKKKPKSMKEEIEKLDAIVNEWFHGIIWST